MTESTAKPEGKQFKKFVWASEDPPRNCEIPATETKIPISSRDKHYNNCTTRTEGLIGAQNDHYMQAMAFYLGNVQLGECPTWGMSA